MEGKYINPYTNRLFEQAEIAKLSPEERFDYEESVKVYRDLLNVVETARQKGEQSSIEIGRAEGRAEGIRLANVENARKMKADGLNSETIIRYTGLTEDEINAL